MRVLALICAVLTVASTASAQKPSQAFLDEYQAGIDAYRLGQYDEAKVHLEKAKGIDATLPGPWRFLAAVAQAEERWADCVDGSREAIRLNPQSGEIVATRKLHDDCRDALGKLPFAGPYEDGTGALSVTTDQVGASVEINGLQYGSTPMEPRTFAEGSTEVSVSKAGYLKATRTVLILPQVVTDVDFVLEVDPDAKVIVDLGLGGEVTTGWIKVETTPADAEVRIDAGPLKLDAQGRHEIEAGPHMVMVSAPGHETTHKQVRVTKGQLVAVKLELRAQAAVDKNKRMGSIAVGTGVGLALVGAVSGILSLRSTDQARDLWKIEVSRPDNIPLDESAGTHPVATRADIDAKNSRAKTLSIISNVSYGLALVSIGVGAYYLVKARPRGDKPMLTVVPILDAEGGRGAAAFGEVRW